MTTNILSKKRKLEDFTTVTAPKGKKYFKSNKESEPLDLSRLTATRKAELVKSFVRDLPKTVNAISS